MALYERINTLLLANTYTTQEQDKFDYLQHVAGSRMYGMNFLVGQTGANQANIVYSIKIKVRKSGNPEDRLYCKLYAADANHKPTGNVLASASIPPVDIKTNPLPTDSIEFILSPSTTLAVSTEYCFIISSPASNFSTSGYYIYMSGVGEE